MQPTCAADSTHSLDVKAHEKFGNLFAIAIITLIDEFKNDESSALD